MKRKERMIENKTMIEGDDHDTMYLIASRWSGLRHTQTQKARSEQNPTKVEVNSVLTHFIERYPSWGTTESRVSRVMTPSATTFRRLYRGDNAKKLLHRHYNISHDEADKILPKDTTDYHLRYVTKKSIEEEAGGIEHAYDYFQPYFDLVRRGGMIITHNNVNDPYTDSLRAVASLSTATHSDAAYNSRNNAMILFEDGVRAMWEENQDEWSRARDDREFHKEGRDFVWSVHQSWIDVLKAQNAVEQHGKSLSDDLVKIANLGGIPECVNASMRVAFNAWVVRDYEDKNKDNDKRSALQQLRRSVDFSTWDLIKTPISKTFSDYNNDDEKEMSQRYMKTYGKAIGYLMTIENDFLVDLIEIMANNYGNYGSRYSNELRNDMIDWEEYPLLSLLFGIDDDMGRHQIGQSKRKVDKNGNYIRDKNNDFVYEKLLPDKECLHEEAEKFRDAWIFYFADKSKYREAVRDVMQMQKSLTVAAKDTTEEVAKNLTEKGLITAYKGEEA